MEANQDDDVSKAADRIDSIEDPAGISQGCPDEPLDVVLDDRRDLHAASPTARTQYRADPQAPCLIERDSAMVLA